MRILDLAQAHSVNMLDIAVNYGNSEAWLGQLGIVDFKFVTKVLALPSSVVNVSEWLFTQIRSSLSRLRVPRLHGLLLHHVPDLSGFALNPLLQALGRVRDGNCQER